MQEIQAAGTQLILLDTLQSDKRYIHKRLIKITENDINEEDVHTIANHQPSQGNPIYCRVKGPPAECP